MFFVRALLALAARNSSVAILYDGHVFRTQVQAWGVSLPWHAANLVVLTAAVAWQRA